MEEAVTKTYLTNTVCSVLRGSLCGMPSIGALLSAKYHTTMLRREWDKKRGSSFEILPEREGGTRKRFMMPSKGARLSRHKRHKALQNHNTETTNG